MSNITVPKYVRDECKKAGFTDEGISALLAQLQKESRFIVNNVEDGRGWTDDEYTLAVDNGSYKGFCTDRIGYGLYQLTDPERKTNFWNFTQIRKASIGDLDNQVAFLLWELYKKFPQIWVMLCTSHDLHECTKTLLYVWENPAEKEKNLIERYGYAQEWLAKCQELNAQDGATATPVAQTLTDIAEASVKKVLELARSEIDYQEKGSNSNLDLKDANNGTGNFTKYGRDLDSDPKFYNGKKNGFAWCDQFVDWLFWTCFGSELAMKMLCQPQNSAGAGCAYSAKYYQAANRWTKNPQPGDQVFFYDNAGQINHTGIVESVNSPAVTTIEGNSNDRVMRRQHNMEEGYIAGFGRPVWELVKTSAPTQTPVSPGTVYNIEQANVQIILGLGAKGHSVKLIQERLQKLGYDIGPNGVDGDFGTDTLAALKQFQYDNELSECGYFGPQTFAAMKATVPDQPEIKVEVADAPAKPAFKKGDTVMFISTECYVSAQSDRVRTCKSGKAKINKISAGAKHPYYVVRTLFGGSNVMGWVDESDLEEI